MTILFLAKFSHFWLKNNDMTTNRKNKTIKKYHPRYYHLKLMTEERYVFVVLLIIPQTTPCRLYAFLYDRDRTRELVKVSYDDDMIRHTTLHL